MGDLAMSQITPVYACRALCCLCGNVRGFKHVHNRRGDWGDRDWHRELGDLKCAACGKITPHALLSPRNDDENMQRVALGGSEGTCSDDKRQRLWLQYRQGNLPRNPYLRHRWSADDAERAWKAGQIRVTTLCGEVVDLPAQESACIDDIPFGDLIAAQKVRDMEYEDPITGLWWVDMECVDCLRVSNTQRLQRQRECLAMELLELAREAHNMNAATVAEVRERIRSLLTHGRGV